jgi:hypothetical protein
MSIDKTQYKKNLLYAVGMKIPCAHMPVLPMALNTIKEFKTYIEECKSKNMSYDDIIIELEGLLNDPRK